MYTLKTKIDQKTSEGMFGTSPALKPRAVVRSVAYLVASESSRVHAIDRKAESWVNMKPMHVTRKSEE